MWRNQQKGFFFSSFASICSTAPNQPTNQPTDQLQSSLPGLSKGRLLPNDHYELQSRRPGAPDQEPEIICTICEASNKRCVRLHHIFWPASVVCAYFVRSNSLVRLQQGDTTRRSILYLDRHDNQNAAEGGIISLCSLACSLASSASTCYAFGGSARSLTRLSHIHALMCAMQCASAYTRPPTHTHTHALVFVKERLHLLSRAWKLQRFNCWLLLRLNRKRDSLSDGARGRNEYCDVKSQRVPEVRQTGSREGMWRIFFSSTICSAVVKNRGFADGLEEALRLISSTCFLRGSCHPK